MVQPIPSSPMSNGRKFDPPENPGEAIEAIQDGQVEPIASYLQSDVVEILRLLADQIDGAGIGTPSKIVDMAMEPAPEEDTSRAKTFDPLFWDSNTAQVLECIQDAQASPTAWFLRDLAKFLHRLGRALDPKSKSDFKLTFERRRAGKPLDKLAKLRRASAVYNHVRMGTRKYGKKEAAVQDAMDKFKIGRSTVMNILASFESRQKQE